MSDIYRKVEMYYCNKGISTGQFFDNNSTEIGRDYMMDDFAEKALGEILRLKELIASAKVFIENAHDRECFDLYDEQKTCRHDEFLNKVNDI